MNTDEASELSDELSCELGEDEHIVTCENGCPDGYLGKHKLSCWWAGHWFIGQSLVKVLGESFHRDGEWTCCIKFTGNGKHTHVASNELTRTPEPAYAATDGHRCLHCNQLIKRGELEQVVVQNGATRFYHASQADCTAATRRSGV